MPCLARILDFASCKKLEKPFPRPRTVREAYGTGYALLNPAKLIIYFLILVWNRDKYFLFFAVIKGESPQMMVLMRITSFLLRTIFQEPENHYTSQTIAQTDTG